jgi:hypothetical protein
LASNGEITAPCPVPLALTVAIPSSRIPFLDQADDASVADTMFQEADQPLLADFIKE